MSAIIEVNMNEAEIVENTVLIAEFMGYEVIPYQRNKYSPIYNGNKYAKTVGEQKSLWNGLDLQFTGRFTENVTYPFDTDFNYLIPIIIRIEQQGYAVAIAGIKYQVYKVLDEQNPIVSLVCGDLSKKTALTYHAVINFLKWLKQNKD